MCVLLADIMVHTNELTQTDMGNWICTKPPEGFNTVRIWCIIIAIMLYITRASWTFQELTYNSGVHMAHSITET